MERMTGVPDSSCVSFPFFQVSVSGVSTPGREVEGGWPRDNEQARFRDPPGPGRPGEAAGVPKICPDSSRLPRLWVEGMCWGL